MSLSVNNMLGGGGSMKVLNGIVGEYYSASETIDAPSFVEFVKNVKNINPYTSTAYGDLEAVVLDSTRVLLLFGTDSGVRCYLTALVVTINSDTGTITSGTSVVIANADNYTAQHISAVLVKPDVVVVAHTYGNNLGIAYTVISISNTTVTTVETKKTTGIWAYPYYMYCSSLSICMLSNGNILMANSIGSDSTSSSAPYYGLGVTIYKISSSNTLTKVAQSRLYDGGYNTWQGIDIVAREISDGYVFISHAGSSTTLCGTLININGTTITKVISSQVLHTLTTGNIPWTDIAQNLQKKPRMIKINGYYVLTLPSSNEFAFVIILDITPSSITVKQVLQFVNYSGRYTALENVSKKRFVIGYPYEISNFYSKCAYFDIDDDGIISLIETIEHLNYQGTGTLITIVSLGNGRFFGVGGSNGNYSVRSYTFQYGLIQKSATKVDGLLVSKATPTISGKVYTPTYD